MKSKCINLFAISILLALYPLSAQAAFPDMGQGLAKFSQSFPYLRALISGMAFLLGIIFMIRALLGFKELGESKTASGTHGIKMPLVLLLVGTVLVFTPSLLSILLQTTFGVSSPLAYAETVDGDKYKNIFLLVNLIGIISFIRGWVMIVGSASQGSHTPMGKAITHIVGGLLAINIQGTVNIMRATFGVAA